MEMINTRSAPVKAGASEAGSSKSTLTVFRALRGELGEGLWAATSGGHVRRAGFEQLLDHSAAELSAGAGDD